MTHTLCDVPRYENIVLHDALVPGYVYRRMCTIPFQELVMFLRYVDKDKMEYLRVESGTIVRSWFNLRWEAEQVVP